jgi:predicted transposase YdaD
LLDAIALLPNLYCAYLNELPLLDSNNPKIWLIGLIIADETQLKPIVEKVKAHQTANPFDGVDWMELLETFVVYKLPHITREEIQNMFGLRSSDLKHTRFYQDTFNEGRLEGEANVLIRQLERRFGRLADDIKQRIAAADADTLLVYADRVLDAKSLDEVFAN